MRSNLRRVSSLLLFAALAAQPVVSARADEGMWLPNKPPLAQLKSKYGFEPSPAWMEHLQKSAVRFQTGGSGSLVSADGLVMTNHHVGSDMLFKLSTAEHNLLEEGFYAASRDQEIKCPDLELNILWEIEDVTARVNDAARSAASPAEANAARRKIISTIESEAKERTGLHPEVVTLYQGAVYNLYLYKSYTDVRLVFAPEEAIAFFGGDTDNFEFPRYDLDCCFFRIYENDKPIKAEHHLDWSPAGSAENELVFVYGHPGRTRRAYTLEHLKFLRDVEMPVRLAELWRREVKAQTFAGRSAENARIVRDELFGVANSRKAFSGIYAGLADPELIKAKGQAQQQLQAAAGQAAVKAGDPWKKLAAAKAEHAKFYERARLLDPRSMYGGELLTRAFELTRLVAERAKPSAERLPEFNDAALPALELRLFSPAPVYDELERASLESWMLRLVERLGGDDATVVKVLAGKSPAARAAELVAGCTFKSEADRRRVAGLKPQDLAGVPDPLLRLAASIDEESRTLRKRYEDQVESVERESYAAIAAAKFAAVGENAYPDATFTLRVTFGPVAGYNDATGSVAPFTEFAGLYRRYEERKGQEGFALSKRWLDAKDKLDLSTPFNFIAACDIIGGNSGSPVVNKKGEVVGLIFDGNVHSLVGDLIYDGRLNRAVAVDSRAIIEAIRKVYGADGLAKELTGK